MDYIEGGTLAKYLSKRGALPVGAARTLLGDIAAGLHHAHERGVVHRDIKPSNVLLDGDPLVDAPPRAVLTDFGIAKVVDGNSMSTANVIGTLDYIAPEQIHRPGVVDRRADVYSLGVLAFKVVTGRRPFETRNPTALMLAHMRQPAPDVREHVSQLPRRLAMALRRAMSKRPQDRHATVEEMMLDMFRPA